MRSEVFSVPFGGVAWALGSDISGFKNHWLCDLGRVPRPLWTSVSSLKWGSYHLAGPLWSRRQSTAHVVGTEQALRTRVCYYHYRCHYPQRGRFCGPAHALGAAHGTLDTWDLSPRVKHWQAPAGRGVSVREGGGPGPSSANPSTPAVLRPLGSTKTWPVTGEPGETTRAGVPSCPSGRGVERVFVPHPHRTPSASFRFPCPRPTQAGVSAASDNCGLEGAALRPSDRGTSGAFAVP